MRATATAAVLLSTAALATSAEAHAHLTRATPAPDATVGAPERLTLNFSEGLVGRFSTFDLAGPGGPVPVRVTAAGATLTGAPVHPLAPGAYRVKWRVVSTDTHHMQGAYGFTVR